MEESSHEKVDGLVATKVPQIQVKTSVILRDLRGSTDIARTALPSQLASNVEPSKYRTRTKPRIQSTFSFVLRNGSYPGIPYYANLGEFPGN